MSVKVVSSKSYTYESATVIHVDDRGHLFLGKAGAAGTQSTVAITAPGSWASAEVISES